METILQTQIVQPIFQKIYEIRGQKVMLDFDLAELYGTEPKYLKRAVNRNLYRFPADFMFQLTQKEYNTILRCQFGTLRLQSNESEIDGSLKSESNTFKGAHGQHRKYLPYAFSEQGVAMLSSVLNSRSAVEVNIAIMRTSVTLRQYALNYTELSNKLDDFMKTTDSSISEIFDVLEELTAQKKLYENRRPIGFVVRDEN